LAEGAVQFNFGFVFVEEMAQRAGKAQRKEKAVTLVTL
jgi:hypothetical protein